MKIGVAGAGAVGGYIGGLLSRSGHDVTFLARSVNFQAMKQKGLLIETAEQGSFRVERSFTDQPDDLKDADLVLFCVKSRDTRPLAESLAACLRRDTAILTLQNGVDQEETLANIFGKERVLSAAAYLQACVPKPGIVKQIGSDPFLVLGALDPEGDSAAQYWARILNESGISARPTPHILEQKWKKLLWNVTFNPLTAAIEAPVGHLLDHAGLRSIAEEICKEAIRVAHKDGIPIEEEFCEKILESGQRARDHQTSMLQDRLQGKKMEIDSICGYIVRRGKALQVDTPVLNTVYQLLRYLNGDEEMERGREFEL